MRRQRFLAVRSILLLWFASVLGQGEASAQSDLPSKAVVVAKRAASYYHDRVASHGGYVYHYSLDLKQRWGEGVATESQIWVPPPGTPTVGKAFLRAYESTGDKFYLEAATEAAEALAYGQLKSGGWTNKVDFNPKSKEAADYRNGKGRGKNNSSLDDGQTSSALRFMIQTDLANRFDNSTIHQSARVGIDALLNAQYPNGAFPQVWTGPVNNEAATKFASIKASYPAYDWRTEGRIKNYWDMYTLNDNVTGYVADTLIEAYRTYQDQRCMNALKRMGDFLLLAQMPLPQPGWAQQYNYEMKPIWARKFEPPGVSGDETQEVLETLMKIAHFTNDKRYLAPIPSAAKWLNASLLPNGQLARYYELKTNRPLYMQRTGDKYELTYSDANLPSHYGWKTQAKLEELGKRFANVRRGQEPARSPSLAELQTDAKRVIDTLDGQDRWVSTFDGERLVGQAKMPIGTKYLSSDVFSKNLTTLATFLQASKSQ